MKSVIAYSTLSFALFSLAANHHAEAQTFSYDGNRWYEIEVSIFTNQNSRLVNQELFLPGHVELYYPEPILQLTPVLNDYFIDFGPVNVAINASSDMTDNTVEQLIEQAMDSVFYGPELREPNINFRLIDKARDPFIALGEDEQEFSRFNRNIELNSEHRILFHSVWRQPVLNKVQASAILISGGDLFGQHAELEGSLLISYNINRVDVDARLWRNSFNVVSDQAWNVPLAPLANERLEANQDSFGLLIDQVYPMLETRQMISNELHYLDHPSIGMLVEVRPYELPTIFDFSLD
ncbi:MAG: CsiV family protein [Gammaproteobacteria bacterium]|jgi:hypothetical protein|nr:CsiV family protein [Gammaproteobacteria bacterium]